MNEFAYFIVNNRSIKYLITFNPMDINTIFIIPMLIS